MPGVPTYRGCDACQKQKKKCDQASPACARCARLKIPCIGQGQLRYKFKEQFNSSKSSSKTTQLVRRQAVFQIHKPPAAPLSEIDSLSNRLISALQVTEPRYDISALGTWFVEVPQRLGKNELFDKATAAFVYSIEDLRCGTKVPTLGAITWYGKALTSLTTTVQDPAKAKDPYTLASIFMLMVSQSWVANSADYIRHMEGVTHLLNASAGEEWDGKFEKLLRFHLTIPAYVESALNPTLQVHPWYKKQYSLPYGPYKPLDEDVGQPIESIDIPQLMRYPELFRDPELHEAELRKRYNLMLLEAPFLLRRFNLVSNLNKARIPPDPEMVRCETQIRLAYAVLVCYALMANGFLSAMNPLEIFLQEEALQLSKEAIWIAAISQCDLPIGAGFMPATLFAAWAATDDPGVLKGIKRTMVDYRLHWAEWHYVLRFRDLKIRMRNIRDERLAELRAKGHVGLDVTDFISVDGLEHDWQAYWEEGKAL